MSLFLEGCFLRIPLSAQELHKNENGIDCFFPKSLNHIKNNFQLSSQKDLSSDATYMHFIKR